MPSAVPCFQWEAEFEQLLKLYRRRKPKCVLEIGTYCGGTLYHWMQNVQRLAKIVSLDCYEIAAATGATDNRDLYPDWFPGGTGARLVVVDGNSRDPEIIESVREEGPFDWIFIDAGHLYEEVRDDWENYRPMAKEGAVVAFHDILPPSRTWPDIQVAWLWKEIKEYGWEAEEIVADYDAEWGGIGVVYL